MKKKKRSQNKPKTIVNKEIDAEDWCFVCKDGGELMICDYGDCLKVYHPYCVKKSETGEGWTCDRHSCSMCHKTPKFQCFCCPNAVCENCIRPSEFVPVLFDGGLCSECLDLVLLAEQDEAYDSDGVMIDFEDRNTHEGLFKEYWEIIKEQVGLTMDDVHAASDKVKKKKGRKRGPVSRKFGKYQDDDDYCVIHENDEDESKPHKSLGKNDEDESKPNKPSGKQKMTKKLVFDGWASKPLIEFLKSIGKDTTESISHFEVDSIIKGYIQEKKLVDPSRKYKVCCDERLHLLFRRKTLMKSRIFYLLETHLLENLEASDESIDDDDDDDGDEDDDNDVSDYKHGRKKDRDAFVSPKKQRSSSTDEQSEKKKVKVFYKESCFASVISDNIKLVYLRRSLVEEFFKQPEKFEEKVVGSFIRVKTDSGDGLQRNSHQLLPVTGIEKSSTGEIFLKVSSMPESVSIRMLSDSNFTKEECEDLQEKIENGVLKKLTTVELQEKVNSLHEDVTKHWIKRELILLQNRIDYANEKGRRRELFNHIERKELLKKPSEQEKLLKNLPKVIPEVVELKGSSDSPEVVEID